MEGFLFFILKSGFVLTLFYILFRFLMSRTTFFRLNRITLLVGIIVCFCLPFAKVAIQNEHLILPSLETIQHFFEEEYKEPVSAIPDVLFVEDTTQTMTTFSDVKALNIQEYSYLIYMKWGIIAVYLVGCLWVMMHLFISTMRMLQLIRHPYQRLKYDKYILIVSDQSISSFSWGKYIIISKIDFENHSEEILLHEMMHLRNHHTLDLLFIQIVIILHWFNPVIWLLRRELQEIHEYEADNGVINMGINATKYQLLLVKKAVGTRLYSMANGFNHSKLKNRIAMMLKKKTKNYVRLRLLLFVPMIVGVLYVFAQPEIEAVLPRATEYRKLNVEKSVTDKFLREEFEREFKAYESLKKRDLKYNELFLFINGVDSLMFNGDRITLKQLKSEVKATVKLKRMASLKKDGEAKSVILTLCYDRAASVLCFDNVLKILREAFEDIRSDENDGITASTLDKALPLLVHFAEPKNYFGVDGSNVISDIVVCFRNKKESGDEIVEVRDFTLLSLKDRIRKYFDEGVRTDDLLINFYWTKKELNTGQFDDVRNAIKEAFLERKTSCPFL